MRTSVRQLAPRPVVIVALVTAVCLLGDSALYVLLPSRLETFEVSPAGAGLILGINRYVRVLSNSVAGWAYERLGFRGPFLFAVLVAAATTAAYGLFTGFWPLFVAHGVWGVAWSFLRLGGYLAVIDSAGGVAIGRYMGALQGISRGGSLFAVLVGGILADVIGGRETLLVFGAVTLTALVLIPFGRVPRELGRRAAPGADDATPPPLPGGDAWRVRTLYAEAAVVWLIVAGIFVSTAGYLVRTLAEDGAVVLGLVLGVGTLSGLLVGVRWVSDLGLGPVFGHVSDRRGRPRVILTAMGLAIAAMLAVALRPTLPVALPAFSVVFVASTALVVSLNASIADLAPAGRRATVLSRYATWADVGSGTGAVIGLPLVTTLGFGWVYGGAAALALVAALTYGAMFARGR